jgi:hypothetical protein
MSTIEYSLNATVDWYTKVSHEDEILWNLEALKSDIVDAALWISKKKRSTKGMVTLWFDVGNRAIPYAIEVSLKPDRTIVVILVDALNDQELGAIQISPLTNH